MAISVKKLEEKAKAETYLIKGVSPAFINAFRRSIMLHVPCLAVENISIYENDSVMFDEFLGHRLGMLPIKTDTKAYKPGDKVKLVLEKEGPCTVYSKDIKSTDPKIEVTDKNIPITRLGKGQKLRLEMQAEMNSGKEHAKWQPATIGYREVPSIKTLKGCDSCGECIKACPLSILEKKGKNIALKEPEACTLCGSCVDACKKDAIELEFDNSTYIFTIEPIAGLTSKEAVSSAAKEILQKSKEFEKALSKAK